MSGVNMCLKSKRMLFGFSQELLGRGVDRIILLGLALSMIGDCDERCEKLADAFGSVSASDRL